MTDMKEWNRLSKLPRGVDHAKQLESRIRRAAEPVLAARRRRARYIDLSLTVLSAAAAMVIATELASSRRGADALGWRAIVAPTDTIGKQMIATPAPPAVASLLASYSAGASEGRP